MRSAKITETQLKTELANSPAISKDYGFDEQAIVFSRYADCGFAAWGKPLIRTH
jgi:hypothetical protein